VAVSTHRVARSAIRFLNREALEVDLPSMDEIGRPRAERRLPVVRSAEEGARLLDAADRGHDRFVHLPTAPARG
jgi:integrase